MSSAKFRLYELDLAGAEATRRKRPGFTGDAKDKQDDADLKALNKDEPLRFLCGRFSPDGKSIAVLIERYRVDPSGNSFDESRVDLAVLDVTTGELRTIVSNPGERLWAPLCWSPDGGEILFARPLGPDDRRENLGPGLPGLGIWAVRPDGTKPRFITTGWCADWR